MTEVLFSDPRRPVVAVVIPCYRVERHIQQVIRNIPAIVAHVIVVDDASPDKMADKVGELGDPRVHLLRHQANQGVGGAMRTGYQEALRLGADIVVKMDGDDQMDPVYLPALISPLERGTADYTKGNRWHDTRLLMTMPFVRRVGNLGLSFLNKAASGYWKVFDPCNGYTAIHAAALRQISLARLASDYFFESSLLVELNLIRAVVRDIPMPARYGDEQSSLRIGRTLLRFPVALARALLWRLWRRYFLDDFEAASAFLVMGVSLVLWGMSFGGYSWLSSSINGVPSTAGTVMLSAMPLLMGFQLLLQVAVLDIADEPTVPRSRDQSEKPASTTSGRQAA